MTTHELKIWPEYYRAVVQGRKRFEIRTGSDRSFAVGDVLQLREWHPRKGVYTGRECQVRVIYLTDWMNASILSIELIPEDAADMCEEIRRLRAKADELEGRLAGELAEECCAQCWLLRKEELAVETHCWVCGRHHEGAVDYPGRQRGIGCTWAEQEEPRHAE